MVEIRAGKVESEATLARCERSFVGFDMAGG